MINLLCQQSAAVHIKVFNLLIRNVNMIASHRNLAQIDTFKDQTQIYIEPVKRLAFAAPNLELQSKNQTQVTQQRKLRFAKLNHLSVSLKINKFKGFTIMVLRLVSGPMLEKTNRTGQLADRQKVLLTATLRVFLFLGFSISRKRKF